MNWLSMMFRRPGESALPMNRLQDRLGQSAQRSAVTGVSATDVLASEDRIQRGFMLNGLRRKRQGPGGPGLPTLMGTGG